VIKPSVCHLTSVHQQFDIRIFRKQLLSLKKAGYDVYQISQGESGIRKGIKLIGLGEVPKSRLKRILFFTKKIYKAALKLDSDIYHVHDPELLPAAAKLAKRGKIVIFDSHENVTGQIEEKTYIPKLFRKIIAKVYSVFEKNVLKKLSGVICVSPNFTQRMKKQNENCVTVTNYPLLSEQETALEKLSIDNKSNFSETSDKVFKICFPGLISEEWCHIELLTAIKDIELEYVLCGPVHQDYFEEMKKHPAWKKVNYKGIVSRAQVRTNICESNLGMALCRKLPNTDYDIGTLGNTKLFEYMLQKRPVCCTNFILWEEIVTKYNCGVCIEPDQPDQIEETIQWFIKHPEETKQMGERGYEAVLSEYNWSTQEKILLDFYAKLHE
jgi:glycosyltransferase involved in cell wall biosynthesis